MATLLPSIFLAKGVALPLFKVGSSTAHYAVFGWIRNNLSGYGSTKPFSCMNQATAGCQQTENTARDFNQQLNFAELRGKNLE